jgi:DNA-binding transcriptional regulator/RsmH inhibitor MraZ
MIDKTSLITPIFIKRNRTFSLPLAVSSHTEFVISSDEESTPCLSVQSYAAWKSKILAEAERYRDFTVAYQEILDSLNDVPENFIKLDEDRKFSFSVDMRKKSKLSKDVLIIGSGDSFLIIDGKIYREEYNPMWFSVI